MRQRLGRCLSVGPRPSSWHSAACPSAAYNDSQRTEKVALGEHWNCAIDLDKGISRTRRPWILSEHRKTHSYKRSRHETQPTCPWKDTRVIPCRIANSSPRFLSILFVAGWLIPSWIMSKQWNVVPCVNWRSNGHESYSEAMAASGSTRAWRMNARLTLSRPSTLKMGFERYCV